MEHLLRAKGLWDHVTGNAVRPGGANAQATLDFEKKSERAFSTIVLSICTEQLYIVTSSTKPKEAWDALRKQFERETLANKLYLKKRYFRCVMSEGTPVQKHLKYMKEISDQLAAIGKPVDEDDQVVALLGSLPPSYSTLVTALEARIDDLTLDFVQQSLINEEQKRLSCSSENGDEMSSAMSSVYRGQRKPAVPKSGDKPVTKTKKVF